MLLHSLRQNSPWQQVDQPVTLHPVVAGMFSQNFLIVNRCVWRLVQILPNQHHQPSENINTVCDWRFRRRKVWNGVGTHRRSQNNNAFSLSFSEWVVRIEGFIVWWFFASYIYSVDKIYVNCIWQKQLNQSVLISRGRVGWSEEAGWEARHLHI